METSQLSSDSEAVFDDYLNQELIQGERIRGRILIAIFGFAFLGSVSLFLFFPNMLKESLGAKIHPGYFIGFLGFMVIYEWVIQKSVIRTITQKRQWTRIIYYGNAIEETFFVTAVIIAVAYMKGPAFALSGASSSYYFIFLILSTLRLDWRVSLFIGLSACVQYIAAAWVAIYWIGEGTDMSEMSTFEFYAEHVDKGIILFLAGGLLALVTRQIKKRVHHSFQASEERNKIVNMFGQHVTPAVVNKLLEQKKELASETRDVTVMFLDIRQFTHFSEKHSPTEVFTYLNTLFEFMIEIVNQNHGIINKFLGDGFMAVFGAPLSTDRDSDYALKVGLDILYQTHAYMEQQKIPPTQIGIGLHTGKAVTGNLGSSLRKEYTVIGDTVNLASRLESLTKFYRSQFLISSQLHGNLKNTSDLFAREMDLVLVQGKEEPVKIMEVFNSDPPSIQELKQQLLAPYEEGFQAFHEWKWDKAIYCFEECLKIYPQDMISQLHLKRAQMYHKAPPPPNWNGVTPLSFK